MASDPIDRRTVLHAALALAAAPGAVAAASPKGSSMSAATAQRMPVLFIGHGSPMNALEDNAWTRGFQALARQLPRPKAILAVSAHWYTPGTFVTGNDRPKTIHDFGGFPRELFEMQYPAPGDPALAKRVVRLLGEQRTSIRLDWGLDHGTWTVLHHLAPKADVPVVQLSIDGRLPPAKHLDVGRALQPLREEGVLVMGSGNVTHNLRHAMMSLRAGDTTKPAWAAAFDADVASGVEQHDYAALTRLIETDAGRLSHPSVEHYLPLLYAAGASTTKDAVSFPVSGFDLASLSMRSILWS